MGDNDKEFSFCVVQARLEEIVVLVIGYKVGMLQFHIQKIRGKLKVNGHSLKYLRFFSLLFQYV